MSFDLGKALQSVANTAGQTAGKEILAPAIAAAIAAPEVQAAINKTVLRSALTIGGVGLVSWGIYRLLR